MVMNDGGWQTPEVAAAQRALVEQQLAHPEAVGPFKSFLSLMAGIPRQPGMTFLDLGCGVGHYGVLLQRYYPDLRYSGYDASPAMIAEAKSFFPEGRFRVRPFYLSHCEGYDLVLAAQVLEYQPDPWAALAFLLRHKGWTILHRLRLTEGESHRVEGEPTYCGHRGNNYLWNLRQVRDGIEAQGRQVQCSLLWEHNASLVVQP